MNLCYLSLGSNQKNPKRQLRSAINRLKKLPQSTLQNRSTLHTTKAWGVSAQQDFCNCVVALYTRLPPHQLLKACQTIEQKHGRVRRKKWGPRTLDIDIIFYGKKNIKTDKLTIPHPYYKERDFVIKPLIELKSHAI